MTKDDSSSHEIALSSDSTLKTSSIQVSMTPVKKEPALNHPQPNWTQKTSQQRCGILNNAHIQEISDIEMKIQLAVLENELAHKEREAQEAVTACRILAKIVASGYARETTANARDFGGIERKPSSEKWQILKEQNQALQRENEVLRKAIDIGHEVRFAPTSIGSDDGKKSHSRMEEETAHYNGDFTASGKSTNSAMYHSKGQLLTTSPIFPDTSGLSSPLKENVECTSADDVSEETKVWGHGFADVGLASLDDIIGPEEDEISPSGRPALALMHTSVKPQISQESSRINEEASEYMGCMTPLQDLAPPTVLKTGFSLSGSFKGGDYNSIPQGPKAFNRLPSGNASFSSSFGSNTSSERHLNSHDDNSASLSSEKDQEFRPRCRYGRPDSFDGSGLATGFFRYGIQYSPPEKDSNHMRRIMISNLPEDVLLKDVLAHVRGGMIVNAILLNTQNLTGGMTVTIQFLHESSARNFMTYTKAHPIRFGSGGQNIEVELVKTPTWPLTTGLYPSLLTHGQTRCLTVPSFPKELSVRALEQHVTSKNGFHFSTLVDTTLDKDGALHLEFSGVVEAHFAYGIISHWQLYSELRPIFSPDPCARKFNETPSISISGQIFPVKSQELARIAPNSLEANEISGRQEDSQPKSSGEPRDLIKEEVPPSARTVDVHADLKNLHSSWADEVIEEAEAGRQSLTGSVVELGASVYAPAASAPSDLPITKSKGEHNITIGIETGRHLSLATVMPPSLSGATHSDGETTCTTVKSKDSSEEVTAQTRLPISSSLNSSVAPSTVPDELKQECLQIPPCIRLDSILENSPVSQIPSTQYTGHD